MNIDRKIEVRTCGQHPGRISGVGGHFYAFTFLHVSEHSEHFFFYYFHGWEVPPPPFVEDSVKIFISFNPSLTLYTNDVIRCAYLKVT